MSDRSSPVTTGFATTLLLCLLAIGWTARAQAARYTARVCAAAPLIGTSANYLPLIRVPASQAALIHVPLINDTFDTNFQYRTGFSETAIFWFGRVTSTENYADVRIGYNSTELFVRVAAFDRRLWYDKKPTPEDLENWDAATLLLDLDGPSGSVPDEQSFRFTAQLNNGEPQGEWESVDQGTGAGWASSSLEFSTILGWRGNFPNNEVDDRGWRADFIVPFSSLGLPAPPAPGTIWGLGVILHDRDEAPGPLNADQVWPDGGLDPDRPDSWGRISFGLPQYQAPAPKNPKSVLIRHGLNGAVVADVAAGGHSLCGGALAIWSEWGQANYDGYAQANIQNQRDLADWPCFSKFFITFPLAQIPAGKALLSATLTMEQFGSAGQNAPQPPDQPSLIQVFTVAEDWSESSLNWNNAPAVVQNVARTWVDPLPAGGPSVIRSWDLSAAVAEALIRGEPLRLALYSADSPYHSGRYFNTSDVGEWNAENRPTLTIIYGDP